MALRTAEIDLDREIPDDSVLAVRFAAARDSILEARNVTAAELRAFLAHHQDLDVQNALWDTIAERLKRPREFIIEQQEREVIGPADGPPIRPPRGDPEDGPSVPGRPGGDPGGPPIHR